MKINKILCLVLLVLLMITGVFAINETETNNNHYEVIAESMNLLVLFFIVSAFVLAGFIFKNGIIGIFGGLGFVFLSFMLFDSNVGIASVTLVSGLLFMLQALTMQN